ncbi:TolB family protein [Pararhizobium arenae]|uniref:TolB family protein n=1 Tax=Pararhizobium arenae TaxID=1856850 RepID=UPI00094B0FCB|nr:PD40 domain-containing protein [Pararhizobium arenae]
MISPATPEQVRWARKLGPQQRAELHIIDVTTGVASLVFSSGERLFESPNWHPDGRFILVNADGLLFRIDLKDPKLVEIPSTGLPELNNDHLISPDGKWHYLSANDGHIYRLPFEGGHAQQITVAKPATRRFKHFLHGISPDGAKLAYVGVEDLNGDEWGRRALWMLDLDSGTETQIGDGYSPADGPDFARDGLSLFFNSEYNSAIEGHAQIFQVSFADQKVDQLTSDERVNWFPHPSPDGRMLAYLSYEPGTVGHPADQPVKLRLLSLENGTIRELVDLHGGQGTINVTSWSKDSKHLAYISYPLD